MKNYDLVRKLLDNKITFEELHKTLGDLINNPSNDTLTISCINSNQRKLLKLLEIEHRFYNKHKNDTLDEL